MASEGKDILLSSLESSGISIPAGVCSSKDLDRSSLLAVFSQSLRILDGSAPPLPDSLPDSTAEQVKVFSDVASAVIAAGYNWGELSFHQFLYPSVEDSYKLVKFLVERLGGERRISSVEGNESSQKVVSLEKGVVEAPDSSVEDLTGSQNDDEVIEIESKNEVLSDDHRPIGLNLEDCNKVEQRNSYHTTEESSWKDDILKSAKGMLSSDPTVITEISELSGKLEQLREAELCIEDTIIELRKREKEYSDLTAGLERLPKVPSRQTYIQQITEISKSIWKQDAEIERIVRDTRELQKESNTIQERLHRTYAVVDETIFRDSKDDPVRRQAYRLLTSVHDSFEQISDTILAMDRVKRESAEHEAKLASITSRTSDIEKLQSDLEALRSENKLLEQHLHHSSG